MLHSGVLYSGKTLEAYLKGYVLPPENPEEEEEGREGLICVAVWDREQQKHIDKLVDAEQYYAEDI